MYKLLVLDLDGTTLNTKEEISKENLTTIKKCVEKGIKVCICTGRNPFNTKKYVEQLDNSMLYVCIDGVLIYDNKEKKYIKDACIDKKTLKELVDTIKNHNVYMELCTKDNYLIYAKNKELLKYSYGALPDETSGLANINGKKFLKNIDSVINDEVDIYQFLYAGDSIEHTKLNELIISKNLKNIELKNDLWDGYTFVAPTNCRKIDGVKYLCEYYNINLNEVVAIGDEMNDFDMIESVGLGIAMGNANKKIKDIAKYVTKTNDEHGVAYAINKFIL